MLLRDIPSERLDHLEVISLWQFWPNAEPRKGSAVPPPLPDYSGLNTEARVRTKRQTSRRVWREGGRFASRRPRGIDVGNL